MLSKTAEYALRAVTCLAAHAADSTEDHPVSADTVATVTQVPRRYLHRVLQGLTAAGLVRSHCGARGGYKLERGADTITILDVVTSVEPIGRIRDCPLGLPSHATLCPLHAELDRAFAATEAAFSAVTIAELLTSTSPIIPLRDSPRSSD